MAGKSATISVNIVGDAKGFSAALNEAEGKLSQFSGKMQDTGKKMMTAGAGLTAGVTLPIAALFKTSLDAFQEAEAAQAQLEASLKSTGATAWTSADAMDSLAKSMQDKLAIDADTIKSGQSILLTFTSVQNKMGEGNNVFDRATMMAADLSAKLGMDLPAANMLLGKALNDPVKGMTALRRSGVQLTEQQQEQVKAFVESGDTLSAQKVILGELETQFAGSAEAAANTSGGKMEALRLKFEDLQESIGERLIPIIEKLGGWLEKGIAWWDKLGERGQTIALIMAGVAAAIGPVVFVVGALVTAIGFLISPVGLVIAAIAGLVAAFVFFYKTNEPFREWVNNVASIIKDKLLFAFNELVGGIRSFIFAWKANNGDVTSSGFPGFMERLANTLHQVADVAIPALITAFNWLTQTALPAVVTAFQWMQSTIFPVIAEMVRTVVEYMTHLGNVIIEIVNRMLPVWTAVWNAVVAVVQFVWPIIRQIVETTLEVIGGIIQAVMALIRGDWGQAWDAIKGIFRNVWDGIVNITNYMAGVLQNLMVSLGWFIIDKLGNVWGTIKNMASVAINGVVDLIAGLPGRIGGFVSSIGSAAKDVGASILNGIGNGISGAIGWVGDLGAKVWSSVKGAINSGLDTIRNFGVSIFGNNIRPFSGLPRLATGGLADYSGLFSVGERGPETVMLPRGSRVVPNHMAGGAGGDIIVNVESNADPYMIGREVAWAMRTAGR